jgi:hypothetical protein
MEEDAKDRIDGFMKIAEYWASRHDGRREFEWKVALGWWGLLALAIYYVHSSFLSHLRLWKYVVVAGLAVVLLLFLFVRFWLHPLWKANKFDKDKSYDAVRRAEALLNPALQPEPNETDQSQRFSKDWSMRFQCLTTLVLLVVLSIAARR